MKIKDNGKSVMKSWVVLVAVCFMMCACESTDLSRVVFEEQVADAGRVVKSFHSLGACTDRREDEVVFVENENAFYVCSDEIWSVQETENNMDPRVINSSSSAKASRITSSDDFVEDNPDVDDLYTPISEWSSSTINSSSSKHEITINTSGVSLPNPVCGTEASCWLMNIKNTMSSVDIDIAFGTYKTNNYKLENLNTGWYTTNEIGDHMGWYSLSDVGLYRMLDYNWTDYSSVDYIYPTTIYLYGDLIALDFWGKTRWNDVYFESVYELPTIVFNCDSLIYPPRFSSSVTGKLIPYIETMKKSCPKVAGNSSLANCVYANDYEIARDMYQDWF